MSSRTPLPSHQMPVPEVEHIEEFTKLRITETRIKQLMIQQDKARGLVTMHFAKIGLGILEKTQRISRGEVKKCMDAIENSIRGLYYIVNLHRTFWKHGDKGRVS